MARSVDVRKLAVWRQRLERFARVGWPVTRFCAAEGVSVASFYLWRKRLTAVELPAAAPPRSTATKGHVFAPVRLVGAAPLVVELPGGTRLQVPAGDVAVLRVALGEIAAADARWQAGDHSC